MSRRPFLVVFSSALPRPPSAVEPLTPPFGFPGRPAGQPGPQPGPVLLGDVPGSSAFGGAGRSGQARAQAGPGARSRLALRGFRLLAGGAAAGLPDFGMPGSARTVLTRSGHSVAVSAWCWCVCCLDDLARANRSRPGGGILCLDAVARLAGSLVAPRGFGRAGLRPCSLLRAVRWPGWSPGRRLHRRPEPLGVIELTHGSGAVPCLFSDPHLMPLPDAGAAAPSRTGPGWGLAGAWLGPGPAGGPTRKAKGWGQGFRGRGWPRKG
jgi:hypothetical protein